MMNYRNNTGGRMAGGRAACGCSGNDSQRVREERRTDSCPMTTQVPVMVYIVDQPWESVYMPCRALTQGTLFPALDKPFFGKGGCCHE